MNALNKSIGCVLLAGAAMVLVGCENYGMSSREKPGNNFNSFSQALYDPSMIPEGTPQAKPLDFPIHLGVAQVGEVAVSDKMLDPMREHGELFVSVQSLSGYGNPDELLTSDSGNAQFRQQNAVREQLRRIRAMAGDMGLTHVLLIGGTIDQDRSDTGLSLLNLTIIGAFIVPSEKIVADAKGGAYLLEVASGRVVLSASADKRTSKMAAAADSDRSATDQLLDVREDVMASLTGDFIDQCRRMKRTALPAAAVSAKLVDPTR